MQIVIDIDEHIYEQVMADSEVYVLDNEVDRILIENAIYNGIPLPEHHGRLVDADWVKNTLDIYVINEYNGQFIRRSDIDTIPTIIEGE